MIGLSLSSASSPRDVSSSVVPEVVAEDRWKQCAIRLLEKSGKIGPEHHTLPDLYKKFSVDKTDEFMYYLVAVIYVESRFNKKALSNMKAHGLMQMTEGAAEVSKRVCNLRPLLNMESLWESSTNIRYGSCYLKQMLTEAEGDWDRALILYNGGYRQLTRYDNGDSIASETANYVVQINRLLKKECAK